MVQWCLVGWNFEEGIWNDGLWKGGTWKNGIWYGGKIHSKKFRKYVFSKINPKEFYEIEKTCETVVELEKKVGEK